MKPKEKLRDLFLTYCKTQKIHRFSTSELVQWYRSRTGTLGRDYYGNLFTHIINKLIFEDKIKKIARGHYLIIDSELNINNEEDTKDWFDEYLSKKVNKPTE